MVVEPPIKNYERNYFFEHAISFDVNDLRFTENAGWDSIMRETMQSNSLEVYSRPMLQEEYVRRGETLNASTSRPDAIEWINTDIETRGEEEPD